MTEGAIGNVSDVELARCVDKPVDLMKCLEGGVFCLDSMDLRDCSGVSGKAVEDPSRDRDLLEFAFLRVAAEHSESPMYFVLPSLRSESKAVIDSSRGVSGIEESATAVAPEVRDTDEGQCGGGSRDQE